MKEPFENYFSITDDTNEPLSLSKAMKIARENSLQKVYDPLGAYTTASWFYVTNLLAEIKKNRFIKDYQLLKRPPRVEIDGK